VGDEDFLKMSRDHNTKWRAIMTDALNAMGLPTPPTHPRPRCSTARGPGAR
jgi:histidinol-phosphate aminotransferase